MTALWITAGWIAVSLLLALAFAVGAGIGYRRGQEDARPSEDRIIRVDEDDHDHVAKRPASRRVS